MPKRHPVLFGVTHCFGRNALLLRVLFRAQRIAPQRIGDFCGKTYYFERNALLLAKHVVFWCNALLLAKHFVLGNIWAKRIDMLCVISGATH
jgi:hypothetical protein